MMSNADKRLAIAGVIDDLDPRFTGFNYQPTNPELNSGFPRLSSHSRSSAVAFEKTWQVVVLLSEEPNTADALYEQFAEPLAEALEENDLGYVDEMNQIIFPIAGSELYGIQVTMRSE